MKKLIFLLMCSFMTVSLKAQDDFNNNIKLLQAQAIEKFVAAIESGEDTLFKEQCAKNGIIDFPIECLCTIVMPAVTALSPFAAVLYAYLYLSDQSLSEFLQAYGYEY